MRFIHRPLDYLSLVLLLALFALPVAVTRSCTAAEGDRIAAEAIQEAREAIETAEAARDYAYSVEASMAALEASAAALASELASAQAEADVWRKRFENAVITIDALELENERLKQQRSTAPSSAPKPKIAYIADVERWRPLVACYFPADAVDDALLCIKRESGGRADAVNKSSGAAGLFQIMPPHNGYDPLDPENNVRIAAKLYRKKGWSPWVTM